MEIQKLGEILREMFCFGGTIVSWVLAGLGVYVYFWSLHASMAGDANMLIFARLRMAAMMWAVYGVFVALIMTRLLITEYRKTMTTLIRMIRNLIGRRLGYEACPICGDTYDWKEPYVIGNDKGWKATIVCQECWGAAQEHLIMDAAVRIAAARKDEKIVSVVKAMLDYRNKRPTDLDLYLSEKGSE